MNQVLFLCTGNYYRIHDVDCATASEAMPALESQVLALLMRFSREVTN